MTGLAYGERELAFCGNNLNTLSLFIGAEELAEPCAASQAEPSHQMTGERGVHDESPLRRLWHLDDTQHGEDQGEGDGATQQRVRVGGDAAHDVTMRLISCWWMQSATMPTPSTAATTLNAGSPSVTGSRRSAWISLMAAPILYW